MAFQKGKPKTGGRKKGVQNKQTVEIKEAFLTVMDLLEARMTDANDVIDNLSPARAAELYTNLLNYIKPKLSSNKNDNNVTGDVKITVEYVDNKPADEDNG